MVIKFRGEIIFSTDTIQLRAKFKDSLGALVDLDTFPQISILQPSGNVLLAPTSAGVTRLAKGIYSFDFITELNSNIGIWSDLWSGTLLGTPVNGEFNFVIHNTQMPFVNTDGYVSIGDDPGFNYSQLAIKNINVLIKTLKARLDSSGKHLTKDKFGNEIFMDCDIFSVEQLVCFIANSLSWFNELPLFTLFTFEDTEILQQFHDVIVQGATIMALSSKALLERGREFVLSDNGISYTPPTVSELMNTEWSGELQAHTEKLKIIKKNMRSFPKGLGTMTSFASGNNPAISRMRFRREGRIW